MVWLSLPTALDMLNLDPYNAALNTKQIGPNTIIIKP